jgi:molybdopterin-guanine dinucleotide biosynthesis protein A
VAKLADALLAHQADAAVAVTGEDPQQQRHPVFMLIRTTLRDRLAAYLNEGDRKVDTWLKSLHCMDVIFDDDSAFANVNTREELQALTPR